jgi:hypothetical protein
MVLLQGSEMMVIPMLPMKMPKQLIRAEAEPVSSSGCALGRRPVVFAPGDCPMCWMQKEYIVESRII